MVGDSSEFLAALEIDGRPLHLLLAGASEDDVRAQLRTDYQSGVICAYRTAAGTDIQVRWSTVATIGAMRINRA